MNTLRLRYGVLWAMGFVWLTMLLVCPCASWAQVEEAWIRIHDDPRGRSDESRGFTVDASGNVFVPIFDTLSSSRVVKLDPAGRLVWDIPFAGDASHLSVTDAGDVYIAGNSTALEKYTADGRQLWSAEFGGYIHDVEVRGSDVYLTGWNQLQKTTRDDIVTVKYDADGHMEWQARFDDTSFDRAEVLDRPNGLAIDGGGNIYVVGRSEPYAGGAPPRLTLLKYAPDGTQIWVRQREFMLVEDVAIDAAGNVVAGAGRSAFGAIKFDSDGNELWRNSLRINNVGPSHAVRVGPRGEVIVAGGEDGNYVAVKFDASGTHAWTAHYEAQGDDTFEDNAETSIAVDSAGNMYLAGAGMDVVKFSPNGHMLWATEYDGPAHDGWESTHAVIVDASRNVYVTGQLAGGGYQSVTIKYTSTEVLFRRGDANADSERDIADAISVLQYLFERREGPICLKAADSNDDGDLNISDPIYLLLFLFGGGRPLPVPNEDCGLDPTADALACLAYLGC